VLLVADLRRGGELYEGVLRGFEDANGGVDVLFSDERADVVEARLRIPAPRLVPSSASGLGDSRRSRAFSSVREADSRFEPLSPGRRPMVQPGLRPTTFGRLSFQISS